MSITRVTLKIEDFSCDPGEISNLLNLNPTFAFKKGDETKSLKGKYYKNNGWHLKSKIGEDCIEIEEHLNEIKMNLPEDLIDLLKNITKKYTLSLACYMEFDPSESSPVTYLSPESIHFLSSLNCDLDIDINVFSKN
jgi:hypothetical protein